MRIRTGFLLLMLLTAGACSRGASGDRREYTLQGQVLSVQPDQKQAVIRHEEIKGFMPAMTMPYDVKTPRNIEGVIAGDLMTATLVVEPTKAYLREVKKVGTAPLAVADGGSAPAAAAGFELIKMGAPVPNQTL